MTLDSPDWSRSVTPGQFTLAGQSFVGVVVTGTRVPLAASALPCAMVAVAAATTNAGTVYLGTSTVTADATATGGLQLAPGSVVMFPVIDLHNVYVNGTAGDGVSLMWWT